MKCNKVENQTNLIFKAEFFKPGDNKYKFYSGGGYSKYICDKKKTLEKLEKRANKNEKKEFTYDKYIRRKNASKNGVFGKNGTLTKQELKNFNKLNKQNQNYKYSFILSFNNDFLKLCKVENDTKYFKTAATTLIQNFRWKIFEKQLSKMNKSQQFYNLSKIEWIAALHTNTNNYHFHILMFENNKKPMKNYKVIKKLSNKLITQTTSKDKKNIPNYNNLNSKERELWNLNKGKIKLDIIKDFKFSTQIKFLNERVIKYKNKLLSKKNEKKTNNELYLKLINITFQKTHWNQVNNKKSFQIISYVKNSLKNELKNSNLNISYLENNFEFMQIYNKLIHNKEFFTKKKTYFNNLNYEIIYDINYLVNLSLKANSKWYNKFKTSLKENEKHLQKLYIKKKLEIPKHLKIKSTAKRYFNNILNKKIVQIYNSFDLEKPHQKLKANFYLNKVLNEYKEHLLIFNEIKKLDYENIKTFNDLDYYEKYKNFDFLPKILKKYKNKKGEFIFEFNKTNETKKQFLKKLKYTKWNTTQYQNYLSYLSVGVENEIKNSLANKFYYQILTSHKHCNTLHSKHNFKTYNIFTTKKINNINYFTSKDKKGNKKLYSNNLNNSVNITNEIIKPITINNIAYIQTTDINKKTWLNTLDLKNSIDITNKEIKQIAFNNEIFYLIIDKENNKKITSIDLKTPTNIFLNYKTIILNKTLYLETIDSDGYKKLYTSDLTNSTTDYFNYITITLNGIQYIKIIDKKGNKKLYTSDLKTSIDTADKKIKQITLNGINYLETIDSDGYKKLYTSDLTNSTTDYLFYTPLSFYGKNYIHLINKEKNQKLYTSDLKNSIDITDKKIKQIKVMNIGFLEVKNSDGYKKLYTLDLKNSTKKFTNLKIILKNEFKNNTYLKYTNEKLQELIKNGIGYIELTNKNNNKKLYTSDLKNSIDTADKKIKQITLNGINYLETIDSDKDKKLYTSDLKTSIDITDKTYIQFKSKNLNFIKIKEKKTEKLYSIDLNNSINISDKKFIIKKTNNNTYIETINKYGNKILYSNNLNFKTQIFKNSTTKTINNIEYIELTNKNNNKKLYTSDLKNSIDITDKQITTIKINNDFLIQTKDKEKNKILYTLDLKNSTKKFQTLEKKISNSKEYIKINTEKKLYNEKLNFYKPSTCFKKNVKNNYYKKIFFNNMFYHKENKNEILKVLKKSKKLQYKKIKDLIKNMSSEWKYLNNLKTLKDYERFI